jgi:alpha-beta hydrolase superfamily lysophospholipase
MKNVRSTAAALFDSASKPAGQKSSADAVPLILLMGSPDAALPNAFFVVWKKECFSAAFCDAILVGSNKRLHD